MIEAAEQVLSYAGSRTSVEIENNPPLQHLFIRNLEIIGEAASRISTELREAYPEIPWSRIIAMRNRLVHAYFDIDMAVVWQTIEQALPELLVQLKKTQDELSGTTE